MGGERAGSRGPVNRCWMKLKCKASSGLTGETSGWLPHLTRLWSLICTLRGLDPHAVKDGPGVTHSMPGTMAA